MPACWPTRTLAGACTGPAFCTRSCRAWWPKYPEIAKRAAAVRQVVMAAVRYNGTNRYATTAPLRAAFEAHRGTAADVNLLLIAALRDAGNSGPAPCCSAPATTAA